MPNTYLPGTITIPSSLLIVGATKSFPMVITVSVGNAAESNSYVVGMAIKLTIPKSYGMFQADGLVGSILGISGFDFSINIDSRLFDSFILPSGNVVSPASICPNGSRNLRYTNGTSLRVPFQSLNNIGN